MLLIFISNKLTSCKVSQQLPSLNIYFSRQLCSQNTFKYYQFFQSGANRYFTKNAVVNPYLQSNLKGKSIDSLKYFNQMIHTSSRCYRKTSSEENKKNTILYYLSAVGILCLGLSYAAVPLYRIFCQSFSYGGTVTELKDRSVIETMAPVKERELTIDFTADVSAMVWNFKPQQDEIKVHVGETALAFYVAKNPTDRPVIGISTYNVLPFEAGQYFNKIQCFCFEEQRLNPGEEVYMPVFFFIDPEFASDPKMDLVDKITLSYTFFEAKEGMKLPAPSFGVQ